MMKPRARQGSVPIAWWKRAGGLEFGEQRAGVVDGDCGRQSDGVLRPLLDFGGTPLATKRLAAGP
jgi:hypothetical protein